VLTPEFVEDPKNSLFDLAWARSVGTLPKEWNFCVGYAPDEEGAKAKLLHYTKGVPIWPETRGKSALDPLWLREAKIAGSTCSYAELMGGSVHAKAS
jgi:hypothetical protein